MKTSNKLIYTIILAVLLNLTFVNCSEEYLSPKPNSIFTPESAFVDSASNSVFFIQRRGKVIYQTENVFRLFYDLDKVNYENRYLLVDGNTGDVLKEFKKRRYTLLDKR